MAWDEVPAKLVQYDAEPYAKPGAAATLLNEYGVDASYEVPEHRREDFEKDLDYRLGACINLRTSKAQRPAL